MSHTYYSEAEDYLHRAKQCLGEVDPRFVFYAAYEMRCCVEARQNAYLEAQKKYRTSLPQRFRIGQQSKELNRIYRGRKIQVIKLTFEDGYELETRYVPVSDFLKNGAERLSKLLHSQREFLSELDLDAERQTIVTLLSAANECVSGNSLTPALIDRDRDGVLGTLQTIVFGDEANEVKDRFQLGAKMLANVHYEPLTQPIIEA